MMRRVGKAHQEPSGGPGPSGWAGLRGLAQRKRLTPAELWATRKRVGPGIFTSVFLYGCLGCAPHLRKKKKKMVVSREWGLAAPRLGDPLAGGLPGSLSHPRLTPPRRRRSGKTPRGPRAPRAGPGGGGGPRRGARAPPARFRQLKGYAAAAARAEGRGGCWQVAPAHWERSLCPAAAEPPARPPARRPFGASVGGESPVVGAEPEPVPAAASSSSPSPLVPYPSPFLPPIPAPSPSRPPTLRTRMPCPEQPSSA